MAKGGKSSSSASSATRKKHARKAAAVHGQQPTDEQPPEKQKKAKGKDKGRNKEPRQKAYIPPVKPAPVQPDPLDTTGLANLLPPDLLVVLRKLGKKNAVTKVVALEELQSVWVDKYRKRGDEDASLLSTLSTMLPVWMHHIPSLFVHPSRRVRLLAVGLHASLLHIEDIRDQIISFLRDAAPMHQYESILGTWCMAAYDIDRQVSSVAIKSWTEVISLADHERSLKLVLSRDTLTHVLSFVQRALLDPAGIYSYLNPIPTPTAPTPQKRLPGRSAPVPVLKRDNVEPPSRSKVDDEAENEQDRKARLRVSSLSVFKWIIDISVADDNLDSLPVLMDLLANPTLWTSLHHAESSPMADVESFGFNQPVVRKAGWALLQSLLRDQKRFLEPFLPILSVAVLRSAWVEPDALVRGVMWQPLLYFLREFPSAWELEAGFAFRSTEVLDEANSEEDDSEDDTKDAIKQDEISKSPNAKKGSLAYQEFLGFLELGCSGSPLQGYPTVVIIVSTLPPAIIASSAYSSPLTDFFTSFWAAVDGRALSALERTTTAAAFLSSLLECMIFLVKRILQDPVDSSALFAGSSVQINSESELRALVKDQFGRTWEALVPRRLRAEHSVAGKIVAQTLVSLDHLGHELFKAAWDVLANGIKSEASVPNANGISLVSAFLDSFDAVFQEGSGPSMATRSLIRDIIKLSFQRCEEALDADVVDPSSLQSGISPLANTFSTFGARLFADSEFSERIDNILRGHAYRLLSAAPSLLLAYLSRRGDQQKSLQVWHLVLGGLSQYPEAASSVLTTLLDAAEKNILPTFLRPQSDELNSIVDMLFAETLGGSGGASQVKLLRQLVRMSDYFLSNTSLQSLFQKLVSSFTIQVDQVLRGPTVPLSSFDSLLMLVEEVVKNSSRLPYAEDTSALLLPEVFALAYLLSRCTNSSDISGVSAARDIWMMSIQEGPAHLRVRVLEAVKVKLKSLLADTGVRIRPEGILEMILEGCPGLQINLIQDIFPSRGELDALLDDLSPDPIHPSVAILESLVPSESTFEIQPALSPAFDDRGFSSWARVVGGLSHAFVQDRKTAKENMWALRHLLALTLYAGDLLHVPWAQSPAFGQQVLRVNLTDLISRVHQVTTYLLTSSVDDGWRTKVIKAMLDNKPSSSSGGLAKFLMDSIVIAKRVDNIREARVLHSILQHVLDNADKDEADQWILLARRNEKTSPETSLAIISAVAQYAPEPPRLDRYRNELAANLLGVPAARANTEGLLILHRLFAIAPDPDSDVVFLPQQRAVNVMKTCQRWISSDEDVGEEVESAMTAIFVHLAPILQNVPGGHWGFIFDVIENNLENCSFTDDSTWVLLARTLRLIVTIQDLASTNKSLRADWDNRRTQVYSSVQNLIRVPLDDAKASVPRSVCRELALKVVQDMPSSMVDEDTLPKMCHLLTDSSSEVQKMAYQFLQEAAKKRTESVVIEAAVDTSGSAKAELPLELVDLLLRNVYDGDEAESNEELFGYFLGWMIAFDLFTNASLKVRSSYIDHLRKLEIVTTHLIPTVFSLLQLYNGMPKAFRLDIWGVDEFYIQYCEPDHPTSIQLLAAHLYYRSLLTIPSLVRAWVLECKDRQLYMTVTSYTAQYFSQVLTQAELAHLKSPESMLELADENMTVKVANSVNEVTASYSVDEHQLEITLKLPSDWPLHPIEVKDTKKVGVVENRWRAWVLGVQQTIWAHNGRIVDGLSLFKKNVALHFEGQVECAICYSIISVMDQSLPRKPCKTCKNRFHSGCLYKWFNSSHSSSCPLCRSDIM